MSQEFLEHEIFRPFSQEYNDYTSSYAGSGLGLSIAKKLVELMGGTISVESEQGVGTKFTIALDFERVDEKDVTKSVDADEKRHSMVFAILKGSKILLAEDHPLNAEIARRLLEKAECKVTWAKDGAECLELFKSSVLHQYDVILMDIRMPVMNGLETAKAIRELKKMDAKTIPIIAMTANAYEDDINLSIEAGMNDHLSKPIEPDIMYETIAKALQNAAM